MNHKLHNTILASAVVGAALLFGLLAARPVDGDAHRPTARHDTYQARQAGMIAAELGSDLARDFEQLRYEPDLGNAGSAGEALAMASAMVATSVVEATLASVIGDVAHRPPSAPRPAAAAQLDEGQAGDHYARRRAALAMPYFSTARGLRRGHGE